MKLRLESSECYERNVRGRKEGRCSFLGKVRTMFLIWLGNSLFQTPLFPLQQLSLL